jgi:hypothetical protein
MSEDRRPSGGINQILSTGLLIVIIGVVVVVGYLIVKTLMDISSAATGVPNSFATQAQQLFNPTPTIIADPVTVVKQIQTLSRLETASYTIEKVITAETGEGALGFLFQDKLLLIAQGEVIAGIDLERLGENDVKIVGTSVIITLPASEIFVATLDNDATYVYDRQTGLLGQKVDLETQARQKAEEEIFKAALEDGILRLAQDNGQNVVEKLLLALGFSDVSFITGTPAPDQNTGGN